MCVYNHELWLWDEAAYDGSICKCKMGASYIL